MRLAVVCPYSWSYPGGVVTHIQALAERLSDAGHDVTVLTPYDPPGHRSKLRHAGSAPIGTDPPGYVRPLGRSVGIPANGSVSNLMLSPVGALRLARALRQSHFDVVHVHEPDAPLVGWVALAAGGAPLVGTFHTYNEHRYSHALASLLGVRLVLNRLHVRVAVSDAAAWTARSYFGGRYRVIPNPVSADPAAAGAPIGPGEGPLRILFIGQPVERKGLPVLLRAFDALRLAVPCELTLIGPDAEDIRTLISDEGGVHVLGKVDDARKAEELRRADVLCAPSLRGESFGIVLAEALAAGTPVVASDIPGYRDLVRPGRDGILVPPGDAQALAEALYGLWQEPQQRAAMAAAAPEGAGRFSWETVLPELLAAYRDAAAVPAAPTRRARLAVRVGLAPADLEPRTAPRRLPSIAGPPPPQPTRAKRSPLRRVASLVAVALVAGLCWLALHKVGFHAIADEVSRASLPIIIAGIACMGSSIVFRAGAWYASLRTALPRAPIRFRDALRGLLVGVFVSSTLPANLGEAARAVIVARRTDRPWESLPVIAGTVITQGILNAVAVLVLGVLTITSVDISSGLREALLVGAVVIAAAVGLLLLVPSLLGRIPTRLARTRSVTVRVRQGLTVLRRPYPAAVAVAAQATAWTLQWLGVYSVLAATHLSGRAGPLGAAAVLCAVNITLLLPVTPGDIGVFQAAAATVLHAGWGVPYADGIAFGIVLQAAELVTALVTGAPALLGEGVSWRQLGRGLTPAELIRLPAAGTPEP